ncbi:hypothetical protein PG993_005755 [Apiospora rasikravindrae]|uniref:Uncharacterized protein n=1 Tax=Apiospora rasikravindrae TaxID=990691 RepID=A0ABR1TBH5_9PEZI
MRLEQATNWDFSRYATDDFHPMFRFLLALCEAYRDHGEWALVRARFYILRADKERLYGDKAGYNTTMKKIANILREHAKYRAERLGFYREELPSDPVDYETNESSHKGDEDDDETKTPGKWWTGFKVPSKGLRSRPIGQTAAQILTALKAAKASIAETRKAREAFGEALERFSLRHQEALEHVPTVSERWRQMDEEAALVENTSLGIEIPAYWPLKELLSPILEISDDADTRVQEQLHLGDDNDLTPVFQAASGPPSPTSAGDSPSDTSPEASIRYKEAGTNLAKALQSASETSLARSVASSPTFSGTSPDSQFTDIEDGPAAIVQAASEAVLPTSAYTSPTVPGSELGGNPAVARRDTSDTPLPGSWDGSTTNPITDADIQFTGIDSKSSSVVISEASLPSSAGGSPTTKTPGPEAGILFTDVDPEPIAALQTDSESRSDPVPDIKATSETSLTGSAGGSPTDPRTNYTKILVIGAGDRCKVVAEHASENFKASLSKAQRLVEPHLRKFLARLESGDAAVQYVLIVCAAGFLILAILLVDVLVRGAPGSSIEESIASVTESVTSTWKSVTSTRQSVPSTVESVISTGDSVTFTGESIASATAKALENWFQVRVVSPYSEIQEFVRKLPSTRQGDNGAQSTTGRLLNTTDMEWEDSSGSYLVTQFTQLAEMST